MIECIIWYLSGAIAVTLFIFVCNTPHRIKSNDIAPIVCFGGLLGFFSVALVIIGFVLLSYIYIDHYYKIRKYERY